ncbi:MAG: bifunctional homocysteine S-methyltransferase/methylenetetrahydrofolate reductase [Gemmatimonadetes bacterium]|nr:bifunctional homocysteine S-methyltransferase/methylenetetrahydrofolate reductase [Gemmatimonadota bacterium]
MNNPPKENRNLQALISDGNVHVLDGAIGTEIYTRGVFVNRSYDGLNLENPELVQAIHKDYVKAGAEIIETNTFGANPIKLSGHGLAEKTEIINKAGAQIAKKAASGSVEVLGAIGPLGIRIEPFGPTAREEAQEFFGRQISGLIQGGVDGFILETFSDLNELEQAFISVRSQSDLPIFCQVTVGEDGQTVYGTSPEAVATEVSSWGADVVGVNCSVGPAVLLDVIERMVEVTNCPISAQPNAGLPRIVADRKMYLTSPTYIGQYASRMIDAGARFLGGCCGTNPEHIYKIRESVRKITPSTEKQQKTIRTVSHRIALEDKIPLANMSELGRKISNDFFISSMEITPPKGSDPTGMINQCKKIKDAGADFISILDSPYAPGRMSSLPAATVVENQVNIETVVHYPCRDRNMYRMISDLLGAAASGIHNLLLVTGRPPPTGPYQPTLSGIDIDSIGLTNIVHGLNQGLDPGGNKLDDRTDFVIGARMNHLAMDQQKEISRLNWKVDAGIHFLVTHPIFSVQQLQEFLEKISDLSIPTIGTVWPLRSFREAEYLHNEIPGIQIPQLIFDRMEAAEKQGDLEARREGIRIAQETFEAMRPLIQGLQIKASDENFEEALELLHNINNSD